MELVNHDISLEIDRKSDVVTGSNLYIQRHVAGVVWTWILGSYCTAMADKEDVRPILLLTRYSSLLYGVQILPIISKDPH